MAIEDFTTYTQVDPNSRITTTTRRTSWTALQRAEVAYVYKDKTADYFDGDFTHNLTVDMTAVATSSEATYWALGNALGNYYNIIDTSEDLLAVRLGEVTGPLTKIWLIEVDGGSAANQSYAYVAGTVWYLTVERLEAIGTYGTLYLYIYSDAGRATLVTTLTLTLRTPKKDFRYIYTCQAHGYTGTQAQTGYTEDLEFLDVLATVTTQPVTSITTTAATGNGIIVSLGSSAVTQHGHCWDSTIDPTTTDSSSGLWGKTSEGDGSVGAFTSSLASLSPGQKYYVRAYATNTEGTTYGANVTFTAGYTSTQLIKGNLAVVQGHLQYIDAYGVEKYIPGIPA